MSISDESERFNYTPPEATGDETPGDAPVQQTFNKLPLEHEENTIDRAATIVFDHMNNPVLQTPLQQAQEQENIPETQTASMEERIIPTEAQAAAPAGQPVISAGYSSAPLPFKPMNATDVQYAAQPYDTINSPPPNVPPSPYQTAPYPDRKWMKSPYNQPYEVPVNMYTMYTPGVYANNPYAHKRNRVTTSPQYEGEKSARPRRSALRVISLILVCVLLSGAASYGVVEYRISRTGVAEVSQNQVVLGGTSTPSPQNETISASSSVVVSGDELSAEDIYNMACSQVVGINTEIEITQGNLFSSNQESTVAVTGSGFIVSSDGYILTNYHVVEEAYLQGLPLKVIMHDETTYDARVVGFEETNDVALIKIDATGLNAVVIANSDNIRVGQRIYAIGNPFGELLYTMTDGIVSALNRELTVERKIISTFQLSAAVNSGNSGGPVYNTYGEVVGIVSAKIMSNYAEGIGFAIPINDAIAIAAELIEHGYLVGRALIGITVQTVSRGQAEYYGWGVEGAYVRSVNEGSAADKAGVQIGDIITSLGGDTVTSLESLNQAKRKYRAGDTVSITVRRVSEPSEDIELIITFDEDLSAGQPRPQG